jgi:tRNA wybutosine-synthesizing protein 2
MDVFIIISKMIQKPYDEIKSKLAKKIPNKLINKIPKKWEKIGNILIIRLSNDFNDYKKEISAVYAKILKCKSVLNEIGGINGVYRIPKVEIIFGSKNTETIHFENGIKYKLDPKKIMFSSGNIDERLRMSNISNSNEIIVDLFAGIGYFSLPIAVYSKPKKIYACEINPISYQYLCKNIVINHVTSIIEPLKGDNKKTSPKNIADRVILGYLKDTRKYLPTAFKCLKNNSGIIHYHDIFPDEIIPNNPLNIIKDIAKKHNLKTKYLKHKHIKSYAPRISHYVFDIQIGEK